MDLSKPLVSGWGAGTHRLSPIDDGDDTAVWSLFVVSSAAAFLSLSVQAAFICFFLFRVFKKKSSRSFFFLHTIRSSSLGVRNNHTRALFWNQTLSATPPPRMKSSLIILSITWHSPPHSFLPPFTGHAGAQASGRGPNCRHSEQQRRFRCYQHEWLRGGGAVGEAVSGECLGGSARPSKEERKKAKRDLKQLDKDKKHGKKAAKAAKKVNEKEAKFEAGASAAGGGRGGLLELFGGASNTAPTPTPALDMGFSGGGGGGGGGSGEELDAMMLMMGEGGVGGGGGSISHHRCSDGRDRRRQEKSEEG
jgi:hypothetical protein